MDRIVACLSNWCIRWDLPSECLSQRIAAGWLLDEARAGQIDIERTQSENELLCRCRLGWCVDAGDHASSQVDCNCVKDDWSVFKLRIMCHFHRVDANLAIVRRIDGQVITAQSEVRWKSGTFLDNLRNRSGLITARWRAEVGPVACPNGRRCVL